VALGQTVTTTISALISDTAGETASISGTVTATAVAAPITINSITSSLAINDQTESLPFAGVVITDPNVGQTETAEVSLSNVANGILFDPNSAADGGYIAYGGSYVVSGTAAAVAAALDGLLFAPTSNEVAAGSTVSTVITALLTDSDGQTSSMATNAVTTATAAPSSVPGPTTIGSGTDTIGLAISEDAWLGNAQFTVAVDGIQIGGIQNAVAIRGQGQQQVFDVAGNFGGGPHTVTVDFLNDLYGGSSSEDRNLFVDSVSYDGTLLPGSLDLYSSGAQSLTVAMPGPTVIGSGADTIAFDVSEDAYQGNAQFTVSVDGTQIGGLETAMAIHGQGQQQVDVEGNFGAGPHSVTVDLVNAYDGGTPQTDRDLYVGDVSFDGTAVAGGLTLDASGPQSLTMPIPGPTAIGSGPETIALGISEDAYLGNAQFTVSVDGTQVGGVQTAEAIHGAGQDQVFDVNGDWQQGANTVTVDFLNDLYAGTPQTDRNLYVDGASIGGTTVGGALSLYSSGSQSMAVNIPVPGPTTIGAGGDTIDLKMSEDYFAGNAQFVVSVDGTRIGGTQTALASHALGQEQDFLLEGNFAAGSHTVSIDFLNDYYQGTPQTDRNLYLGSATLDGTAVPGAALNLYSNGTQSFTVMVPSS